MSDTNLTPISAKEYKAHAQKLTVDGVEVKLPSGFVFRVRRPQLSRLLASDAIPNHLSGVAMKMMNNQMKMETPADVKKSMELVDKIVMLSVVAPEVVAENPTEDQIAVSDLSDDDKMSIFVFVQGGETALDSFRKLATSGKS